MSINLITDFERLRLAIFDFGIIDSIRPLFPSRFELMLLAKRNKRIKQLEREERLQEIDEEKAYRRELKQQANQAFVNELTNLFQRLNEVVNNGSITA